MLYAIKEAAPIVFAFVHSAYSSPSSLHYGSTTIPSAEGVQQGDPPGPLLFCLTIHPLIQALKLEYKMFYLDDGTLGGRVNSVLEDLQLVGCLASELGLQLNRKKTEVIGQAQAVEEVLLSAPDLQVVPME